VVDAAKGDSPGVDWNERVISAGCAVQNMLLMATALGFGSALTSGKALKSAPLRGLFGLAASEQALCFLSFGSLTASRPGRPRPAASDYLSVLGDRG
jgi:nitroreductase